MSTGRPIVLVIGGGVAGLRTALHLVRLVDDCDVVIVEQGRLATFDRTRLSKFVPGDTAVRSMLGEPPALRGVDHPRLTWVTEVSVVAVDTDARVIALSDGRRTPFDFLVVASGVRAREMLFDHEGEPLPSVRNPDDAVKLYDRLLTCKSAIVYGAGILGCELAHAAQTFDVRVMLVGSGGSPLRSACGPAIGERIAEQARGRGVVFVPDVDLSLPAWSTEDGRREALSASGVAARIGASDTIEIQALGSVPNTEFLAGSVACSADGKVLVDADFRSVTSEHIFAVGDVAATANGGRRRHRELWLDACASAKVAACAIAGQIDSCAESDAVIGKPTVLQSQFFGVRLLNYGERSGYADEVIDREVMLDGFSGFYVEHLSHGSVIGASAITDSPHDVAVFSRNL